MMETEKVAGKVKEDTKLEMLVLVGLMLGFIAAPVLLIGLICSELRYDKVVAETENAMVRIGYESSEAIKENKLVYESMLTSMKRFNAALKDKVALQEQEIKELRNVCQMGVAHIKSSSDWVDLVNESRPPEDCYSVVEIKAAVEEVLDSRFWESQ